MTDPMNGLSSFQEALLLGTIEPRPCKWNKNLQVLEDNAEGELRITHARIIAGETHGIIIYCIAEAVESVPCFAVGYAVAEKYRGKGVGTMLLSESIEELSRELHQAGLTDYYLEAVVGVENTASNKIAAKVLSAQPVKTIDKISGKPAFQYLRRFKAS